MQEIPGLLNDSLFVGRLTYRAKLGLMVLNFRADLGPIIEIYNLCKDRNRASDYEAGPA